jgi:hypothetical protein
MYVRWIFLYLFSMILSGCRFEPAQTPKVVTGTDDVEQVAESLPVKNREYIETSQNVWVKNYFSWTNNFLDSINQGRNYRINEYVLVMANPFIKDSLRNSDYYVLKDKGKIQYDPKASLVLSKGTMLYIPDSLETWQFEKDIQNTRLDLNIPEFLLRVYRYEKVIDSFVVRVGKNKSAFLAMAGKELDLRTKTGKGKIVRINKTPLFINPVDNKRYKETKRDDGNVTQLPNIPWLEVELNGNRYGQMLHPTTNLKTTGKAASNGCIGLREADAWSLFLYAPLGTPVIIRYDLKIPGPDSTIIQLKDVYDNYKKHKSATISASSFFPVKTQTLCYCGME